MSTQALHDVLVVGAGPAGAAAGFWLAEAGHDVVVVERAVFPRDKTCGDALSPRSVKELTAMGLGTALERFHRYGGLRTTGYGCSLELPWPAHPDYPSHGVVARRRELDELVANTAVRAGATLLTGTEAVAPIVDRGFVRGAVVQSRDGASRELRARYVVVADGANSRFGRALGTFRAKNWPYGTAIRGYWESPLSAEHWIETTLDVKDRNGNPVPGYGWIFPLGDGTVNVGVGLLSTFRDFKSVNTTTTLNEYLLTVPERWELRPAEPIGRPVSGRLPMGGSVGPKAGPTYLLVGDAAGTINPFSGEGTNYAYETARLAAGVLHEALDASDPMVLQTYPRRIDDAYGQYFKVARLFAELIGRPAAMRQLTKVTMHHRSLMEWVLRIMANMLRPDELGAAELAYKAAATLARLAPDS